MIKKGFLTLVLSCVLVSGAMAGELKKDMTKIAHTLSQVQMGFFSSDKVSTLKYLQELKTTTKAVLGDKEKITKLLPKDVKYKSSIAINSAHMIVKYVDEIESILNNKNMRMIKRQMQSQKAFVNIQNQCFRCHNLVRDWK